jgi:hypothetical protein
MALAWLMPCCSVEGCSRTWTENDHRIDWAKTRHTRLDELDPLCKWHHQLKTLEGWALVAGKGKRAMVPRDDPRHPKNTSGDASGDATSGPPDGGLSVTADQLFDNRTEPSAAA